MQTLTQNDVGHSDLFFNGPLILLYVLNSIYLMNVILCDTESVWWNLQPKIRLQWPIFSLWYDPWPQNKFCHSDLYFTVPLLLCHQLRRSWRGILVSGCPSVRLCIRSKHACHILWTMHARVHIWIPDGKIFDIRFFSCPSYLPFWSYAPLKKSEQNLMHAISYEPCMLGFWNFIYGFLMEKFLVWVISLSKVMPLWKKQHEILSARYLKKYLS